MASTPGTAVSGGAVQGPLGPLWICVSLIVHGHLVSLPPPERHDLGVIPSESVAISNAALPCWRCARDRRKRCSRHCAPAPEYLTGHTLGHGRAGCLPGDTLQDEPDLTKPSAALLVALFSASVCSPRYQGAAHRHLRTAAHRLADAL